MNKVKISPNKKKALNFFLTQANKKLKPYLIKAILYGSSIKGKSSPTSDIDLLLVYNANRDKFLDKVSEVTFDVALKYGEFIEGIPMSIFNYRANRKSSFYLEEIEKGKVVYKMKEKHAIKLEATDYLNLGREFYEYGRGAFQRREYRNAIDDAYNGIELFVKALILLRKKSLSRSHGGIIQQFGKLYIVGGKVPKQIGRGINKALILRGEARYNPKADIKREDARMVIELSDTLYNLLENEIGKFK